MLMEMVGGFCGRIYISWKNMGAALNDTVSSSIVGRYFKLAERRTTATKELRAATTTFLAMAYIITVSSSVLAETGGTCPASDWPSPRYESCISVVKTDLVVSVSLASMLGCFAMGLLANLPFGLAPGTGQCMYMVYNLVGLHGSGPMSYEDALGLWMAEAVGFLLVSGSGLRSKLGRLIPISVRLACAVGIGLFMAFVGLQVHQGVGLIGPDPSSLVTMTACAHTDPTAGECHGQHLNSPTFWLGLVGFLIMAYGLAHDIKGSMIYGILFVTFISWFRGTSVTYFPNTSEGNERYNYFKKGVDFHMIHKIAGKVSFKEFTKGKTWVSLFTLIYIDLLATTGGMYTLAEIGGFINDQGEFENEYIAYMIDAGVTVVGCLLGTPSVVTYAESTTGMREGGKTGLTAVIIGMYFFLSLFFAPLLTSVPPWAIGPSLVMIGVIMMKVVKDIDWGNIKEAVPAFVTMILMPLTSSIPNGIISGVGAYVVLNLYDWLLWLVKEVLKLRKKGVVNKDAYEEADNRNNDNEIEAVGDIDSVA